MGGIGHQQYGFVGNQGQSRDHDPNIHNMNTPGQSTFQSQCQSRGGYQLKEYPKALDARIPLTELQHPRR